MKTKKITPVMLCHLVLMAVLVLSNLVACVRVLATTSGGVLKGFDLSSAAIVIFGLVFLVNALALCCGILYLLKGYAKQAAPLYKGFLLLTAIAAVLSIVLIAIITESSTPILRAASLASLAVKCILLLVLAFAPNLGKRNTWILFGILLAVDVVFAFFFQSPDSFIGLRITNTLSRLLQTGTIGLAIKGKYDDKDARGTT